MARMLPSPKPPTMNTLDVLIVEDQHDIAANIWDFLERRGHRVDHAGDGSSGLSRALHGRYDAIVLDSSDLSLEAVIDQLEQLVKSRMS